MTYTKRRKKEIKAELHWLNREISAVDSDMMDIDEPHAEYEAYAEYVELDDKLEELEKQYAALEAELERLDNPEYAEEYELNQRTLERFGGQMPRSLHGVEWWKVPLFPQSKEALP